MGGRTFKIILILMVIAMLLLTAIHIKKTKHRLWYRRTYRKWQQWTYQNKGKTIIIIFCICLLSMYLLKPKHLTRAPKLSLPLKRVNWEYPAIKVTIHKHKKSITTTLISKDSYHSTEQNVNDAELFKKTTLIMMCYQHHEGLFDLLRMYGTGSYNSVLSQFVLIWNNPTIQFNATMLVENTLKNTDLLIDIVIYQQKQNSLANRWMIAKYHSFTTQSAMFIDDDIYASVERIKCLLNVWNANKNKIVSSGGYRSLQPTNYSNYNVKMHNNITYPFEFHFKSVHDGMFNYLLPGWGMTVDIGNIFKLSNMLLQYHLFDIIDGQIGHCDDIAIALVFAVIFGEDQAYFYGIDEFRMDTNETKRSKVQQPTDSGNYKLRKLIRDECLNLLLNQLHDYGLDYIPIYNHSIAKDTINCNEMSMENTNNALYCPLSACYIYDEEAVEQLKLDKKMRHNMRITMRRLRKIIVLILLFIALNGWIASSNKYNRVQNH